MRDHALQLDLPDDQAASIFRGMGPWMVAIVATVALVIVARDVLADIPDSIARKARSIADAQGETGVEIAVDGRDLELSGLLSAAAEQNRFVSHMASIPGVRIVLDGLTVFDPEKRAREQKAAFGDALGSIDTSVVSFEPGRSSLAAGSEGALAELQQLLDAYPEFRVRVAGHTDNTGRAEVNLRLSRERAAAVADWLVSRGIDPKRVIAQGYGATQPIADNASETGRTRNRRIEIRYVD